MARKKEKSSKQEAEPADVQEEPAPVTQEESQETTFPIVGIGASAGGLAAFEQFFTHLPPDSGVDMAFVLVQHLDPTQKSILCGLLQDYTRMPVCEVEDGVVVQANCVYVIPPGKDMALLNGKLHLMEPGMPRGLRLPIDFFFRSLAQDQGERAIGIVLSGTASDGTLGLRAIKEAGGLVVVQDPKSAQYNGMPHSAIATGVVDYILPPDEMPARLIDYVQRPLAQIVRPGIETDDALQKIFILLRSQTGYDFSHYKEKTVHRRLARRLAINQIKGLERYARYLQRNPLEADALFRELLIGVTQFFRDSEAFAALQEKVIPRLFENLPLGQDIRVWVTGCSTGEEAYSIAILLLEYMDERGESLALGGVARADIQIFATDIDDKAIETARAGVYPEGIVADVSPERLRRFFSKQETTYQVNRNVRDTIVFAVQSLIKDPPFSRVNLISCRNLLIYLQPELQKKALSLFHYALNPNGYLFLGTSETVGELGDLFGAIDTKHKLYQHKGTATRYLPAMAFSAPPVPVVDMAVRIDHKPTLRQLAEKTLLKNYGAACMIINEKGEILYTYGRTGRYLEPAVGDADWAILPMAREGLQLSLRTALHKAALQKQAVRQEGVWVKTNGDIQYLNLTVEPILEPPAMRGLMAVVFEATGPPIVEKAVSMDELPTESQKTVARLRQEVESTREHLQAANEELETTTEELKSVNEDLQLSNEELQSRNEELGTSQEELRRAQQELEASRDSYADLYDYSPVGYITVSEQETILEANLTVAGLLGVARGDLIKRPLSHFIAAEDQDIYYLHRQQLFQTQEPQVCELRMVGKDGTSLTFRNGHSDGTPLTFRNGHSDGTPLTF